MPVHGADELAQEVREVLRLGEPGQLRRVAQPDVEELPDARGGETAEEVLGRRLREPDRPDLHRGEVSPKHAAARRARAGRRGDAGRSGRRAAPRRIGMCPLPGSAANAGRTQPPAMSAVPALDRDLRPSRGPGHPARVWIRAMDLPRVRCTARARRSPRRRWPRPSARFAVAAPGRVSPVSSPGAPSPPAAASCGRSRACARSPRQSSPRISTRRSGRASGAALDGWHEYLASHPADEQGALAAARLDAAEEAVRLTALAYAAVLDDLVGGTRAAAPPRRQRVFGRRRREAPPEPLAA